MASPSYPLAQEPFGLLASFAGTALENATTALDLWGATTMTTLLFPSGCIVRIAAISVWGHAAVAADQTITVAVSVAGTDIASSFATLVITGPASTAVARSTRDWMEVDALAASRGITCSAVASATSGDVRTIVSIWGCLFRN